MDKAPEAFRTISEVAAWLGVQPHVLRFWESKFPQIKPVKRAGGRRYYRPADMLLLGGLKQLLHEDGLTIKGAQKVLREQGVQAVQAISPPLEDDAAADSDSGEESAEESRKPKQLRETTEPTVREVCEHNLTHIPYRTWCAHCVRGKAKIPPTQKTKRNRRKESTNSISGLLFLRE